MEDFGSFYHQTEKVSRNTLIPDPDPDPLARGTDPRIRIRTKMSGILTTGSKSSSYSTLGFLLCLKVLSNGQQMDHRIFPKIGITNLCI
jgi:hypothetical protein